MKVESQCPACLSTSQGRPETWSGQNWQAQQCRECGHVCIHYSQLRAESGDLHDEYDQGAYTKSLKATRRRQAELILEMLKEARSEQERVAVDYGAGLGVMTAALLVSKRYRRVIALDTSPKSQALTRELGAVSLPAPLVFPTPLIEILREHLPEDPSQGLDVFALDLIEHFESSDWTRDLHLLLKGLGRGSNAARMAGRLILKFPNANGFFHGFAIAAARLGWSLPFHRLALAESSFPHRHIFTPKSIQCVADRADIRVERIESDLDFEPESFFDRLWSGRPSSSTVTTTQGLWQSAQQFISQLLRFATPLIKALIPGDSLIVVLRWDASVGRPDSSR
ncbi:MAG TPA: class I SAM-dependent methyltransferase [Pseudobdellovibrionaceae bacterium]|nr:class I SAM-dependent methyltransferase [Pseudobdellovibrionaceae bacterium]